jgi:hypothetical protein
MALFGGRANALRRSAELLTAAAVLYSCWALVSSHSQQDSFPEYWEGRDPFDEILQKFYKVSEDNCAIMHVGDLKMPEDSVSHLPDIKEINQNPVFPNRTALLHLHNMALSRAFFFSYILQSRFHRPSINDTYDPGMMYYFLSTIADVSANPKINASSVYFSPNMSYTSSYRGFFNLTMPLFGPRTYRCVARIIRAPRIRAESVTLFDLFAERTITTTQSIWSESPRSTCS